MTSRGAQQRSISCVALLLGVCCGSGVAGAQSVTYTPYFGGQELVTDNVLLTPTNQKSDLVTSISPGITVNADTTRLHGTLDYSPTFYLYAFTPGQNQVGQNLYANGTATLARDLLFFDARGYATFQPSTPGLTNGVLGGVPTLSSVGGPVSSSSQGIPSSQLTQVTSFSASPYLVHRFDGFGTGELRYTLSDTNFSGGTNVLSVPNGVALQNTTQTTNEATALFQTGENFGRLASRLLLNSAQSGGTGVFNNASHQIATVDSAYAITRRISALATFGYEDIRFSGVPPTRIKDVVWAGGILLTPSSRTKITVTYGHQDGITAPNVSVSYAPTELTTLSVSYSEGLSTAAQDIANNLAVSDVNVTGQLIDTRTSLPLLISNPALGLQSGVFRSKNLTSTAALNLKRDQISVSVYYSNNGLVAQSTPGTGTSEESTGGTLTWSHELSERSTLNFSSGYTHFNFPSSTTTSEENLFTIGATATYMFSSSLTGWAGCYHINRDSPQPSLRLTSNSAFVGFRKNF